MYLNAFFSNAEFPGGISFRTALNKSNLDVTWESLDRVDYLLDQIRGKIKPEFGPFLNEPANQNFLYFLCFCRLADPMAELSPQKPRNRSGGCHIKT